MTRLYCSLAVVALVAAMAMPALAVDLKGNVHHETPFPPRVAYTCDEGYLDNAYYQYAGQAYGNGFSGVVAGPLSSIEYWHYGWFTLQGPYSYLIHVYDQATCTEVCLIGPLEAADAFDHDELEFEDLCEFGCSVEGDIAVLVEPLSCYSSTDCYPDVYFDQTGVYDGCDRIVLVADPSDCNIPYGNGDFVLRIGVDECPTPTESTSWSQVKADYR